MEFEDIFKNPPSKYRGMPFWAWNTKLDQSILEEQIQQFKKMGMGGFYIHTRVGLDTEYLGKTYMDCVRHCVEIARKNQIYCCLYDEDRWPSGYGGGYVTKNPEYRSKALLFTPWKKGEKEYLPPVYDSRASFSPQGNGEFMAAYQIQLNDDGTLHEYIRCGEDEEPPKGFEKWYAYLEIAYDSPWFNNQAYVDTLSEEAVQCFIHTSYERYYLQVGEDFGGVIPSIFTDEPQFLPKGFLGAAKRKQDVMIPFTRDFNETFYRAYQTDFLEHVPEIIWELPGGEPSAVRYLYHEHLTKRFAESYSKQIGSWCEKHNIKLCGHMMEEPTLQSQTKTLGEVMRCLREFSLPGIDMLCDAREYTTAKQAQSICRQYNRAGVVSELYGVTNWDFDFRRHKLQGDWQAALGVANRVHHLSWMSMGGEGKRDFPATISYQSPWYQEYSLIEDHFARVNTALTRGKAVVKAAVIHPVESMWILFGPAKETSSKRSEMDERFLMITDWLLFNNIDFDYLSESLIPELRSESLSALMEYEVLIIPGCKTLRSSTLELLMEWKALEKKVVFMGEIPDFLDAKRDESCRSFASSCKVLPFSANALMEELEEIRDVDIRYCGEKHLKKPNHKKNWDGERTGKYIYQLREEEDCRWLFLANARPLENPDRICLDHLEIRLKGSWGLEKYNTVTGDVTPKEGVPDKGDTLFYEDLYDQDSLLIKMTQGENYQFKEKPELVYKEEQSLFENKVQIVREEPNVLLLDMAEYSLDGVSWEKKEEILRIDTKIRTKLGYPLRIAAHAQPWTMKKQADKTQLLILKYTVICEQELKSLFFAAEELNKSAIYLDGQLIDKVKIGYYVDRAIEKIRFPDLTAGNHEILMKIDFDGKANLEPCYLLGDFTVEVSGSSFVLKADRTSEGWFSLIKQGMPFYGGNAAYHTECFLEASTYELTVSKFRSPLLSVKLDGRDIGKIAFSPYCLTFEVERTGNHRLEILSYGNRINTFGAVHDCDEREIYFDSNAWRTVGEDWAYEYQLKETGILKAPVIRKVEERGKDNDKCDKI